MTRTIAATCLVTLSFGALLIGIWPTNDSLQESSTNDRHHDFGVVGAGVELTHRFQVRNPDRRRLVLTRLGGPCCADVVDAVFIVAPSSSATIPIQLRTEGRSGRIEQVVSFSTSAPSTPQIDFTLSADVQAPDIKPIR